MRLQRFNDRFLYLFSTLHYESFTFDTTRQHTQLNVMSISRQIEISYEHSEIKAKKNIYRSFFIV